jgi:hypothetical protein
MPRASALNQHIPPLLGSVINTFARLVQTQPAPQRMGDYRHSFAHAIDAALVNRQVWNQLLALLSDDAPCRSRR